MFTSRGNRPCDVSDMGCFDSSTVYGTPVICNIHFASLVYCATDTQYYICSHDSQLQNLDELKPFFFMCLSATHVYLCVGVNSCLHLEEYVAFCFFLFFICGCVIV